MNEKFDFPFDRARRVTPAETEQFRRAIENTTLRPRKGRKPNPESRHVPISFKIDPMALRGIKREAAKRAIPYQTLMNDTLLRVFGKRSV